MRLKTKKRISIKQRNQVEDHILRLNLDQGETKEIQERVEE